MSEGRHLSEYTRPEDIVLYVLVAEGNDGTMGLPVIKTSDMEWPMPFFTSDPDDVENMLNTATEALNQSGFRGEGPADALYVIKMTVEKVVASKFRE